MLKALRERFKKKEQPRMLDARFVNERMESHGLLIKGLAEHLSMLAQEFGDDRSRREAQVHILNDRLDAIDDVDIRVFKEHPSAFDLAKENEDDACYDVFVAEDMTIPRGERGMVETGLVISVPSGWEVQVRPRSSISANVSKPRRIEGPTSVIGKLPDGTSGALPGVSYQEFPRDLTIHLGTGDAGYRKTYKVIVENGGTSSATIKKGDKIAQLAIRRIPRKQNVNYVTRREDLHAGDSRGEKGFGSSGSNKG